MKIPRIPTDWSLTDVPKREVTIPAILFAGAAGSLAYGTYTFINQLRSQRSITMLKIAAIGGPVLIGGGLAYLGYRDWKGEGSTLNGAVEQAKQWVGSQTNRKASSARRGRGRGRARRSAVASSAS